MEVLDRIARTLREKGEDALTAEDLKQAAMTRVAGFEIMPAPYVIAHWQVGHVLRAAGVPLGENERAAVYLTNALTGWVAPEEHDKPDSAQRGLRYSYPPLAEERDEAARVKQARPILVVLGNPPYNAFAGTSPAEESGLVEPYKEGLQRDWGIRKFNLDELYVRFFRIAERRIAEGTGRGIVCFISNHSWIAYPSFVLMRRRLLAEFDRIWVDELHGDRKSSERGPDGRTSETIFAMAGFSPGIRQGTAITVMVRNTHRLDFSQVLYSDGANASQAEERRAQLLARLAAEDFDSLYRRALPSPANRFSLLPAGVTADYLSWPMLPALSALPPFSGVVEKRRGALMSLDRAVLAARMQRYLDSRVDFEELKATGPGPIEDMARFNARETRRRLLLQHTFSEQGLVRVVLTPFEIRWVYHTNIRPLWNEPRPELAARAFPGNGFIATRFRSRRPEEGLPVFWTTLLPGDHLLDPNTHPLPVLADPSRANLSIAARDWLADLGFADPDQDRATAMFPWHHVLAIAYAPAWLSENADGIRQDWPRVPLPDNADLLRASAQLGSRVAALLDPDVQVPGVTAGTILPELSTIAVPSRRGGGSMTEAERAVTAGWGHAGKDGAVMPGRGRVVARDYAPDEAEAQAHAPLLGLRTSDIYLNADAYWRNVPDFVWNFTIGGYQVMKKWLSYREQPLLKRALLPAEIRYMRDMARRLAAIRLMAPELDANYCACTAAHYPLRAVAPASAEPAESVATR